MTNTNQNRPAGGNASGRTTSAWRRAIAAAFPHTVPVLTGYLVLGAAYGVLMQSKGFGAPWVLLMSAVAFCGSMQFAAITLLTSAFDPLGAFIMSVMVNARHLFYGVSMLEKYRGLGGAKPILIYTLSDETFSVVFSAEPPPDEVRRSAPPTGAQTGTPQGCHGSAVSLPAAQGKKSKSPPSIADGGKKQSAFTCDRGWNGRQAPAFRHW